MKKYSIRNELRIDTNDFKLPSKGVGRLDIVTGVVDHNYFELWSTPCSKNGFKVSESFWKIGSANYRFRDGSCADDTGLGSGNFIFVEDNAIFHGFLNDCDASGRYVMRRNYFRNSVIQAHEMGSCIYPVERQQGCRVYEVYQNNFILDRTCVGSGGPGTYCTRRERWGHLPA
jgi:hypothetical protein